MVRQACPEFIEGLTMTGHPELVEGCRNVCPNNYVVLYRRKRLDILIFEA